MKTLGGFPCLPAFRLRRAKPGFAIAKMKTRLAPRKRGEAARRSLAGEGTAPRPETEML
jgi:hypothetical protein